MESTVNRIIKKVNRRVFDNNNINEYNNIFNTFKKSFLIKSINFSDLIWEIDNTYNNSGYINKIDFTGIPNKYQIIIKCLLLEKMNDIDKKISPETLVTRYRYLIKILKEIGNFEESNLEKFKEIMEINKEQMTIIARMQTAIYDLYFFTDEDEEIREFLEITSQYYDDYIGRKARELPDYKSILIFDTKINNNFLMFSDEEKLKYYLLYLWWKITMIIPLRPNDFLKLKYDCCWKDDYDRYWIRVPRSKVDDKKARIKLVYTLECSEMLYKMIEDYKRFISNYVQQSEYLFPFELRYITFSNISKGNSDISRIDKEKQNNNDANLLIRKFEEKYLAKEIENGQYSHITMGDTRHYAFCNMILQGLNPLVIAQIGGHTTIESQLHYYQQIETCTNAYTKELAFRYRVKNHKIIASLNNYNNYEYRSRNLLKLYSEEDKNNFLEIEKGYCIKYKNNDSSIKFHECREYCHECEYHIIDFDKYPEMREFLKIKSNEYNEILCKQLDLIKDISKDIKIDYDQNLVEPLKDSKLLSIGKNLINNINQKAIIDGKLLEYILGDEYVSDGE